MIRHPFVCLVLLAILSSTVSSQNVLAEETPGKNQTERNVPGGRAQSPSGHLTMELGQGALILSALAGKGTLAFQGKSYKFKVGGVGIGGIGASVAFIEGEVYNLSRLEDFSGAYFQLEGGYAAVEGTGVFWLRNSNGVDLELRSKTKGLIMTVGAEGVVIHMENPKK